jgi:hypothetical protein
VARPRLRRGDRLFCVALSRLWRGWTQAWVIVAPDTVLCWQRRRFRDDWTRRSRRSVVGRPAVAPESRALVAQMAAANPPPRVPRLPRVNPHSKRRLDTMPPFWGEDGSVCDGPRRILGTVTEPHTARLRVHSSIPVDFAPTLPERLDDAPRP